MCKWTVWWHLNMLHLHSLFMWTIGWAATENKYQRIIWVKSAISVVIVYLKPKWANNLELTNCFLHVNIIGNLMDFGIVGIFKNEWMMSCKYIMHNPKGKRWKKFTLKLLPLYYSNICKLFYSNRRILKMWIWNIWHTVHLTVFI